MITLWSAFGIRRLVANGADVCARYLIVLPKPIWLVGESRTHLPLLQSFDEVQIRKHAVIPEDTGFGVGGKQVGAEVLDAWGMVGHELVPRSTRTGLLFVTINPHCQSTELINVN